MSTPLNRATIHQWVFVSLLILTVIGMQFSHFLVSISIILMSANFLAEGDYLTKLSRIKKSLPIILFVSFFLLHVLGLLWSTDLQYGLRDIEKKLPILAFPVVIGASSKISRKQFEWVLLFFIATSVLSSIVGSIIYFVLSQPGDDYREMSPFMSHIRLSLMMGVAIYSSIFLAKNSVLFAKSRSWFIGLVVWFVVYLFMLRAMSGIVAVLASVFVLLWMYSSDKRLKFNKSLKAIILVMSLFITGYIYWQVEEFYDLPEIDLATVDKTTKEGEGYYFDLSTQLVENGNYVYTYIAREEMRDEWNKQSKYDFKGKDAKGQVLESTLLRYLTSKNLRKDREGVQTLTHIDIWAVENGIANERFLDSKNLNTMVYKYLWEIHNFTHGYNPQGNSLGQRFLFWRIGSQIFTDNFWIGVGTGDVKVAFKEKYESLTLQIQEKYRLRAHNQYLTIALTFGIFGIIFFLATLFSGFTVSPYAKSYLFLGFFVILMTSMLDEDTLETQFGVTFAMYFYFLFLFQQPKPNNTKEVTS